jgi:TatD DNase family protein
LEDAEFAKDLNEVIVRAKEYGIVIVTSGLGLAGATRTLEIAKSYNDVFCTVGFEPYSEKDPERVIEFIRDNVDNLVGIGEVGLDFWWGKTDGQRKKQKNNFRKFIQLAKELDLPLVIHSRSAGRQVIEMLMEEDAEKVLMHAFDGRAVHALKGVERGFFFSIPPSVIRSVQKQKLVKQLPLEMLCLESDAPVLGLDPKARNEPMFIIDGAKKIAELKGLNLEEVLKQTTTNAKKLYSI